MVDDALAPMRTRIIRRKIRKIPSSSQKIQEEKPGIVPGDFIAKTGISETDDDLHGITTAMKNAPMIGAVWIVYG